MNIFWELPLNSPLCRSALDAIRERKRVKMWGIWILLFSQWWSSCPWWYWFASSCQTQPDLSIVLFHTEMKYCRFQVRRSLFLNAKVIVSLCPVLISWPWKWCVFSKALAHTSWACTHRFWRFSLWISQRSVASKTRQKSALSQWELFLCKDLGPQSTKARASFFLLLSGNPWNFMKITSFACKTVRRWLILGKERKKKNWVQGMGNKRRKSKTFYFFLRMSSGGVGTPISAPSQHILSPSAPFLPRHRTVLSNLAENTRRESW